MEGIPELEWCLNAIVQPQLGRDSENIECSNFTRHMWSHTKDLNFSKKKDLYEWCREIMEIEVLSLLKPQTVVKTTKTRGCLLCMKEKVQLFFDFARQKEKTREEAQSKNLLNSRREEYSACNCRMQFSRLRSHGSEGIEEAVGS